MSELDADGAVAAIAAGRIGPPVHVLERMARAGRRHDELRRDGRRITFSRAGAPLEIELRDAAGDARSLSVCEAFELAAGGRAE